MCCEKSVARQMEEGWPLSYRCLCSRSEESLGQKHLAAKVERRRRFITCREGDGRALGKKATAGDLIPEVSILIKSLI